MKTRTFVIALCMMALGAPLIASAQSSDPYQFRRQGVFGCNVDGAYSMSVGSLSAVGGLYVPVNDAAVTLNTGYLVYKECVLRGAVNRQREAITSETVRKIIQDFLAIRDGNPAFPQDLEEDRNNVRTQSVVKSLQNGTLDTLNPAFREQIKRAIAQNYSASLNKPTIELECGYDGDLRGDVQSNRFSWELLTHLMDPACNPYYAGEMSEQYVEGVYSADVGDMMTKLAWNGGIYDAVTYDEYGDPITKTPGSLLGGNVLYALQSGFRQQESANDIDQMVGALFGGITAQIVGDTRGLMGLVQQTGSQPSYLDQIVREANNGVRQAAANAALQILAGKKAIEQRFNQVMRSIASLLTNTANGLRTRERQCWELIIERVCASELSSSNRCTATSGETLRVATSTVFSQRVINRELASLATSTAANVLASDAALQQIDRLIAGVTNSSSLDAQRAALQQLDQLVASRALHSEADVTQAEKTKESLTSRMETLLTDTVKEWTEDTSPERGWCKVDSDELLEYWIDEWNI